jgi:uncharacterized membrane protein YtjA (UPF0391 family)
MTDVGRLHAQLGCHLLIIAIVAAVLGLRGISGMTAEIGYFFAVLAASISLTLSSQT